MSKSMKPVALVAGSLALAGSSFAMSTLPQGYMLGTQHGDAATHGSRHGEGKCGMERMDADKDGKVSRAEFAAAHEGKEDKFAGHDANGDGYIDAAEMKAHHEAKAGAAKASEGKCGEGKCGAGMHPAQAATDAKADATEGKCGEGKCGEGMCGGQR